jgi:hypothetical protein
MNDEVRQIIRLNERGVKKLKGQFAMSIDSGSFFLMKSPLF